MRLFEPPRTTVELRDYQTHTLELIRDAMEAGYRRILVCAPPGTGKGTLIAHIVQAAKERGNASLFVVHRRELVRDMSARVSRLGIEHSRVLPGWDVKSYADVYVSTIQSYLSNYRKRWIVRAPVVIIIDEAHRITPGDGMYHELLSTFPNAIVLGFTATPTRTDGRGLGDVFETLIEGIDWEGAYRRQVLVPFKYFVPESADLTRLKKKGDDFDPDVAGELMEDP